MLANLTADQVKLIGTAAVVIGGLFGWFGRGVAFLLSRHVTGAKRKEHVDYLTSVAGLMGKLRNDGSSVADVNAFDATLRSPALATSNEVAAVVGVDAEGEIDAFTTTFAMRMRANAQYAVADAQLAQVICDQQLVLDENEREATGETHARWRAYRRGLMEAAEAQYSGGTLGTIVCALVGLAETERRTAELRSWVEYRIKRLREEEQAIAKILAEPWPNAS